MGYVRDQRKFTLSPSIILKGHWMAALGFETGQKVQAAFRCPVDKAIAVMGLHLQRGL
ncbi:SymE family type I addiction module toxin [Pantoea dispersa]|uniref:Type I toxin-antitoxin system SymE family toxin n=1 Tax=Pantoea dispersa TaxID=59814 RepID=A0ABY3A0D9_9GAMM|nr:SymE family type I addiction module toxin [Pantoea dispersa]TQC75911.1 type I toxin-antitoxin system SymE family toxin [Pantoea dispersa]